MGQQPIKNSGGDYRGRRPSRLAGMTWIWISLASVFALGAGLSLFLGHDRSVHRGNTTQARRSYFGVDQLQAADGGVTFDAVEPAGGPADQAGLVGGDIITSLNGGPIKTPDDLMDLLNQTPVGKTVEVNYIRDGISYKTKLKTISADDFNRLRDVGDRPAGMFGFEIDGTTRISLPESKTYGVRLDHVQRNGPADLFGAGDIVTDFDKAPIRTARELLSRVRRASPRSTIEVVVLRNGETRKISVTMGESR